jgi:hypothetical protein
MHKIRLKITRNYISIKSFFIFQLDESTKRQNDIGVPPDGLDKYKDIPTKQVNFLFFLINYFFYMKNISFSFNGILIEQ